MRRPSLHSRGTLLFDGDCGFCTRAARWAIRINPAAAVTAWQQADLDELGVTPQDAAAALQYVDATGSAAGSDAVAYFLIATGGVYVWLGRLLLLPGLRTLAGITYGWVAAHRHRLPGGTPACATESMDAPGR